MFNVTTIPNITTDEGSISTHPRLLACPPGWSEFQRKCYLHIQELRNWFDARTKCSSLRYSDLASIHSKEEDTFIQQIVKTACDDGYFSSNCATWLGATKSEGTWSWSDASLWNYEKEIVYNKTIGRNCLVMTGSWYARACGVQQFLMCQLSI